VFEIRLDNAITTLVEALLPTFSGEPGPDDFGWGRLILRNFKGI